MGVSLTGNNKETEGIVTLKLVMLPSFGFCLNLCMLHVCHVNVHFWLLGQKHDKASCNFKSRSCVS